MTDNDEKLPYETDHLDIKSDEEIAKLESDKQIIYLINAAIGATRDKHPKAQSSEVHRITP